MKSKTINFADVAHQTLSFEQSEPGDKIVLDLIDTSWVQRLRNVSQTGNTKLVYMFAEHSRFGHSLGVAYLAKLLMDKLKRFYPNEIEKYQPAVSAAAILHDIGHVAPGSHLAEKIWGNDKSASHEEVTKRIIKEDKEIQSILSPELTKKVIQILDDDSSAPSWARAIITGGGWNADRGNWSIVDSTMCAVSYGRYNVMALIDAFRLDQDFNLVLGENRIDALTHFFVARDSMYRQIYQHRVLQAVDALTINLVRRFRRIYNNKENSNLFCDETMKALIQCKNYSKDLELKYVFNMTEHWWMYHVNNWVQSEDKILSDLAKRLRDRNLFKTIKLTSSKDEVIKLAKEQATELGYDPEYYICLIEEKDKHRGKKEKAPNVLLDTGEVVKANKIDPTIDNIISRPTTERTWLAVPKEVKEKLGRQR